MTAPIYVYYQLDNFYQNHRRFVKSRSNEQLMGNNLSVADLDDCDPVKQNRDLGEGVTSVLFAESFPSKNEWEVSKCLYVGTSLGSVLVIVIVIPDTPEARY